MKLCNHETINLIVEQIEHAGVDIAPGYAEWRDMGFALVSELGEGGRGFFHRLSRQHADYKWSECEKQYTRCVESKGSGVTIATLYHLAKRAGVVWKRDTKSDTKMPSLSRVTLSNSAPEGIVEDENVTNFSTNLEEEENSVPTLSDAIYEDLPLFLKRICDHQESAEDRDLLLLGSLTTLSGCLPNVVGRYRKMRVYPNLFLYVTAPASAGKGRLGLCKRLVTPIHRKLRGEYEVAFDTYREQEAAYLMDKKGLRAPVKPQMKMLFVPANSGATAMFQMLYNNKGRAVMFETEGDTLAQTFKSEFGNYSDGFRKAFHHEEISYLRKTDNEYVAIEEPRLSVVLSGTPQQVHNLIPSTENGLFSRFMFYYMRVNLVWLDVFDDEGVALDEVFDVYGKEFLAFNEELEQLTYRIEFRFTSKQRARFNYQFEKMQLANYACYGEDYLSTVRRLGLVVYRIAMILSALRMMEDEQKLDEKMLVCSDVDFRTAMRIVEVLNSHAAKVYQELSHEEDAGDEGHKQVRMGAYEERKRAVVEVLKNEYAKGFTRKDYKAIANSLKLSKRTLQRYLKQLIEAGEVQVGESGRLCFDAGH